MKYQIMNINELDNDLIAKYFPMLTKARQSKIAGMQDFRDRTIALCSEIVARQCLSELCNAPEFSFQLLCNPNSRSYVGNYGVKLCIVSSGDYVACAASRENIGISIVPLLPFSFDEAQEYFSDSELRAVFSESVYSFAEIVNMNNCCEPAVIDKYALLFSLKEAHFYACGRGFRSEIKKVRFDISVDGLVCSDHTANICKSYIDSKIGMAVSIVKRC